MTLSNIKSWEKHMEEAVNKLYKKIGQLQHKN